MSHPQSFLSLLERREKIPGEIELPSEAMDGVALAKQRAAAHIFERGASSDVHLVAQQNIASTSVQFNLGYGWREHFCPAATAVYVVPPDADACWRLDGDSQCVYMAFPRHDAQELLRQFGVDDLATCLWSLAGRGFDEAHVHEIIVRLWTEVSMVGPNTLLGSSSRIAVLHALARRFQRETSPSGKTVARLGRATLNRVLAAIHELPPGGISIEKLAQEAGLSPFHFSRLFRNTTGRAPYSYYDELRYQRATILLTTTELTMADIANQLGFSHPSQFTRAFQRRAGCSPSVYRRQGRA